tara:strand:- start:409 stop:1482 length:1074 start_codon:yes stop_codon:yes gene_type:complete
VLIKRKYDVIFYYPQHFNRGVNNDNQFFKHILLSCDRNNISYIVFEEPDFTVNNKRNSKATPFDFIYIVIILLRKLYSSKLTAQLKDQKIGGFISRLFFRNLYFNNYITLSQSMLSVFRGINPDALLYDLQHGIIHNNKENYLVGGVAESNLVDNEASLFLSGASYKNILVSNEKLNYFQNHALVIGSNIPSKINLHESFNNNILITLQFTHDHTAEQNEMLFKELSKFVASSKEVKFYLKNHPRFNDEVNLSELLKLPNVMMAPNDINECFSLCSLHATAYSTSTFEAALLGIPTILILTKTEFNYFQKEFSYPLNNVIGEFDSILFYQEKSKIIKNWATAYYTPFNEPNFINSLR